MRQMPSLRTFAAIVFLVATWSGCNCSDTIEVDPNITPADKLVLDPANLTLEVGQTRQVTATLAGEDVTKTATWTSPDHAIATVGSGDTAGLIVAVAQGTTTIAVKLQDKEASLAVTVTPPAAVTLQSITVAPATASAAQGQVLAFTAQASYSDGSTGDVTATATWASDAADVLAAQDGTPGAFLAVAPGSAKVSATVEQVSGEAQATVTDAVPTRLTLVVLPAQIPAGARAALRVLAGFSDGTTGEVTASATFASSAPAIAAIDSGSPSLTGLAEGTAVVTATFETLTDTAEVTVSAATPKSLTVLPGSAVMPLGTALDFAAREAYSDGSWYAVTDLATWTSSAPAAVSVSDAAGSKGHAQALAAGQARLAAKRDNLTGQASVAVSGAPLVSLEVSPATLSVPIGRTVGLRATGRYADGAQADLTTQVAWTSSDAAVATVVSGGARAGAATSLAAGTALLTASFGGKSAHCTLTVSGATLSKVEVVPATATLVPGMSLRLAAQGTWTDGSVADVTADASWSVQSGSAVYVDDAFGSKGTVVALAQGAAVVAASLGSQTGTAQLTVSGSAPASLAIVPASATLAQGASRAFAAEATLEDGTKVDATLSASWSTGDAAILLVSNDAGSRGLATGVSPGQTSLVATFAGLSASAQVTVGAPEVTGIELVAGRTSLNAGTSTAVKVVAAYSDGSTLEVTSLSQISSSSALIVAVADGQATALAAGTATLTATYLGFSDSIDLTVSDVALAAIELAPAASALPAGVDLQLTATGIYADGSRGDLTATAAWASSAPAVATVDGLGLVHTVSFGEAELSATFAGIVGTARVVVTDAIALAGVAVTPDSALLAVGGSLPLTATATYSDGSTRDVTALAAWTSSDAAVAAVSDAGLAAALSAGEATIRASFGGKAGTSDITVTTATLTGLAIDPASATVFVGGEVALKATGTFDDGSTADVTAQATWSAQGTAASVSDAAGSKGVVTGVQFGTAEIVASLSGLQASAQVQVSGGLTSLAVTPATASVSVGQTMAFTAQGTDSAGATVDVTAMVTWTTAVPEVATISNAQGSAGVAVAVGPGTTLVVASLGSLGATATLTVGAPQVTGIRLVAGRTSLPAGAATDLAVWASMSDGTFVDATGSAAIESDATGTVAVIAGPKALAVSAGQARLTASHAGFQASLDLTVTDVSLVALSVSPAALVLPVGTHRALAARGTFSDGAVWDVTAACTWTSGDAAVATVSGGTVTAVAVGQTTVTASLAGKTAAAGVEVADPSDLTAIAVSPATATATAGGSVQFAATATWTDGSTSDVTDLVAWSSSAPAVASIGAGKAGLALALSAGDAVLTATSGTVSGSATLTVVEKQLQSLALLPASAALPLGGTVGLRAVASFADASTTDVTEQAAWSVAGAGVLTVGDAAGTKGRVTALAKGWDEVVASFGGLSARATITVDEPLASIEVLPATAEVALGEEVAFTARGIDLYGSVVDVTGVVAWSTGAPGIASVSNVAGSEGRAQGLAVGQSTVVAKLGSLTASADLTVGAARLRRLALSPATAALAIGEQVEFTATGTWSDGSATDLTAEVTAAGGWASSTAHLALTGASGLAVSEGVALVTATLDGVSSSAAVVTVGPVSLDAIVVEPTSLSLPRGTERALTATGRYSDGSTADLTSAATWKSSADAVAAVSAAGVVHAASLGDAEITATLDGVTSDPVAVTVTAAVVSTVAVAPDPASIRKGETQEYTATATYTDGSEAAVTGTASWRSSDPAVATMSGNVAFGAGVGGTFVVATVDGVDSAPATLTVNAAGVKAIALTPATASAPVGLTASFQAEATMTDDTLVDVTGTAQWASDAAVATVASGVATGVAEGQTAIVASLEGIDSPAASLTVTAPVVVELTIDPQTASVPAGRSTGFRAWGTFSDGSIAEVTDSAAWTTSSASIATVSAGWATGQAQGEASLGAQMDLASASATLTVTAPVVASLVVAPQSTTTDKGRSVSYTAFATFSDGSTGDVTSGADWVSTDETVATIDAQGVATTHAVGMTNVQASRDGVSSNVADLTVGPAVIEAIAVAPLSASVPKGVPVSYSATARYTDGTTEDVTGSVSWDSSDPGVATLDAAGTASTLAMGTTLIRASRGSVTSAPATLTVEAAAVQAVAIAPATASVAKGLAATFTAEATLTDGSKVDVTESASWTSDDTTVATVSAGQATGKAEGTTSVYAAAGGKTSPAAALTVTAPELKALAVTPWSASVVEGGTQQYAAQGTYTDDSTADVTASVSWTSSDLAVATIGGTGLATTQGVGQTEIWASSGAISSNHAVLNATAVPVTLTSIALTPTSATVDAGGTVSLVAVGTMSDGSYTDINASATAVWTSSDLAVATVDAQGKVTTHAAGEASIAVSDAGVTSNAATVHVNPAVLVSISVGPAGVHLARGLTQAYTVLGTWSDGSTGAITAGITWASSNPAVATLDVGGVALAREVGVTNVTAHVAGVPDSDPVTLTVGPATVASLNVTPVNPAVAPLFTVQFAATATYTDGTLEDRTADAVWSSGDPSKATVVATSGLATGVAAGSTLVSAAWGGHTGSTTLTVTNATLLSIGVTPTPLTLPAGVKAQLTATGYFSDGTARDITDLAAWSTTNAAAVTVGASAPAFGLVRAVAAGTASIRAQFGSVTGSAAVTATSATVSSIEVVPTNAILQLGFTLGYAATGRFSDGSTVDLTLSATWASTSTAVATISNDYPHQGVATGVGAGSTTIRATFGSVSGSTALTVSVARLVSLNVTPALESRPLGLGLQYVATGNFDDGTSLDVTESAAWTSSDSNVAAVSNAAGSRGYVATLAVGPATITATAGGMSGSGRLTVTDVQLVGLLVTPANPRIGLNGPVQFTATGVYSDGTTQDLTYLSTWTSANTAAVEIRNDFGFEGLALGKAAGSSVISATYSGLHGSTTMTVTSSTLVEFYITPILASVGEGLSLQYTASGVWLDGTTADMTQVVLWASSKPSAAQVSNAPGSQGLATGIYAGVTGTDTAIISATYGAVSAVTNATLKVLGSPLQAIAVTPASLTLPAGVQSSFTATGSYADGSKQDLTSQVAWSTGNAAVASVSGAAGSEGWVTALSAGTTTVTAMLPLDATTTISGSASLTVVMASLLGIALSPTSAEVPVGFWVPFTATASFSGGLTVDVTALASWTTGNVALAVANNAAGKQGQVSGVAVGSTAVNAAYGGMSGTASVTVTAATLTSVTLYYWNGTAWSTFPSGGTKQPIVGVGVPLRLRAVGTFSDGLTMDVTQQCAWRTVPRANGTVSNVDGSRGEVIVTLPSSFVNVSAGYAGSWFGNDKVYSY